MIRSIPSRCSDRRAAWFVAAAIALASAPASAQPDDARDAQVASYQQAVSRGYKHFENGDYADARAQFEKAYQIQPTPLLLFNIASTYRRENKHETALAYYNKFLDVAPADDPQRRQAEEAIELLKEKLALEERRAPRGNKSEQPDSRDNRDPLPPVDDDGGSTPGRGLMWTGVALGVVGLGGLGYGGWQAKRSIDASNELEGLDPGTEWTDEQEQLYSDGQSAETRAIVASIVGTAVVLTGTTLFVIGLRRGSASEEGQGQEVMLTPYASDREAGLAVFGRF